MDLFCLAIAAFSLAVTESSTTTSGSTFGILGPVLHEKATLSTVVINSAYSFVDGGVDRMKNSLSFRIALVTKARSQDNLLIQFLVLWISVQFTRQ
jgi:hypothetical protein